MKKKQVLQKVGAWILSAALAVSCLSGIPATDAAAAGSDLTNWKSELYIDFGTGLNITNGTDTDLAANILLAQDCGYTCNGTLIAGYGTWLYDSTDVGTVYGETASTQKIGFDRVLPAGRTNEGGEYFRDWVFSPDGKAYTFSVDLPKGQYYVYVYNGNKTTGYRNTSKVSFSDNGYQIVYDHSHDGGGQHPAPDCVYVVNVDEKTAGSNYGTLGVKIFDDTIVTADDGYDSSYTDANTVFYGTDPNTAFNANDTTIANGTIVTARLNGIEIMPVANAVKAERIVTSEDGTNINLEVNMTQTLEAKVSPATATERIEYYSSDENIVKVDPKTGELTGVSPGTATVTATTPSLIGDTSKSAVYNVTVFEETTLSLDPATLALQVGGQEGADTKTIKAAFNAASLQEAQNALVKSVTSDIATITFGDVTEETAPADGHYGTYSQEITIKATDKGSDTIAITRTTGRTASLRLTVTKPVTSVAFYDGDQVTEKYTMVTGSTLTVSAKGLPEDASNTNVTYKFKEATDIATMTTAGRITAKKAGTATICATSRSNTDIIAEATLTITPGFSIQYKTDAVSLEAGKTTKNELSILFDENVDTTKLNTAINYDSSDTAIATVSNDGTVKGVKAGTAIITATAEDGGQKASYKVNVTQPAATPVKSTAVTVAKKSISLKIKKTATIKATLTPSNSTDTITYTSKNPKIASVDKNGKVTALKPGKTTITVKTTSGKSQTVTVTVTSPATKVTLKKGKKTLKNGAKLTLKKGKKLTLKATVTPKNSTDKVTWSTNKKKVATVTKKGVVTAKKKGTVTITAKAGKKKATVKITVK